MTHNRFCRSPCNPSSTTQTVISVTTMIATRKAAVTVAAVTRPRLSHSRCSAVMVSAPERSWIALNAKSVAFKAVFVDLQNKPEWFFKHNPYGRVPTLVWTEPDGQTASLYESLVVNEYISDLEGPALLPQDPAQRARARLIIDQFGVKFGAAFGKLMFASDADAAGAATADLNNALQWVEGELGKSEGPLFLGKDLSLVDAAVAPFLLRLRLLEGLSGYKLPAGLPRVASYTEVLLAHPAVAASMCPPDASRPYFDQLLENYKEYVAKRKAAAAAST